MEDVLAHNRYASLLDELYESVFGYEEGGYRPVDLGDKFKNGRYEVRHKLGDGGILTFWLARDHHM